MFDINLISAFIIMLNPIALFLYLKTVMESVEHNAFVKIVFKASIISFIIYLVFATFGESIFVDLFKINFDSFRVFGGIVIFTFSFLFLVKGQRSMISVKESTDEMASELAMPFMVGAGSISVSILIGHKQSIAFSALNIGIALVINFIIVIMLKKIKDMVTSHFGRSAFDKVMNVLVRVLAFMVGAIGVDMVVKGLKALFNLVEHTPLSSPFLVPVG